MLWKLSLLNKKLPKNEKTKIMVSNMPYLLLLTSFVTSLGVCTCYALDNVSYSKII